MLAIDGFLEYAEIEKCVPKEVRKANEFIGIISNEQGCSVAYLFYKCNYMSGIDDVKQYILEHKMPIIFKECEFNRFNFSNSTFDTTVTFEDCVFTEETKIERNIFNKNILFENCSFKGITSFSNNCMKKCIRFSNLTVTNGDILRGITFQQNSLGTDTYFNNCNFDACVFFKNMYFKNTICTNVKFCKRFDFVDIEFDKSCYFREIDCGSIRNNFKFQMDIDGFIKSVKNIPDFVKYLEVQRHNDGYMRINLYEMDLTKVVLSDEEKKGLTVEEQEQLIDKKIAKEDNKYSNCYISLTDVSKYLKVNLNTLQQKLNRLGIQKNNKVNGYALNDIRHYIKKYRGVPTITTQKAQYFSISSEDIEKSVISLQDNLLEMISLMLTYRYSVMPVIEKNKIVGVLNPYVIVDYIKEKPKCTDFKNMIVEDLGIERLSKYREKMVKFIKQDATYSTVKQAFATNNSKKWLDAIFITENGRADSKLVGIIVSNDFVSI